MHVQNLRALFSSNTGAARKILVALSDRSVILERIGIESKLPGSLYRKVNLPYSSLMVHIHRSSRKTSNTNNRRHDRHRETPNQQQQEQKYE